MSNSQKAVFGLGLALATGLGGLLQSCLNGQPPTRSQVEAGEDKFCAAVAKFRALEKASGTLPDAGSGGGR